MSQDKEVGFLPGWTLLVPLVECVAALATLWACRDAGLSWWICLPATIAVVAGGIFLERAIERNCLRSQRSN